jgi:hypothetical protein
MADFSTLDRYNLMPALGHEQREDAFSRAQFQHTLASDMRQYPEILLWRFAVPDSALVFAIGKRSWND